MRPPSILRSARVTHYAIRDHTVGYVRRGEIWSGNRRVGAVPCLAITHDGDAYLLNYCNRPWELRRMREIREAKRVERLRAQIAKHQRRTQTSGSDV